MNLGGVKSLIAATALGLATLGGVATCNKTSGQTEKPDSYTTSVQRHYLEKFADKDFEDAVARFDEAQKQFKTDSLELSKDTSDIGKLRYTAADNARNSAHLDATLKDIYRNLIKNLPDREINNLADSDMKVRLAVVDSLNKKYSEGIQKSLDSIVEICNNNLSKTQQN